MIVLVRGMKLPLTGKPFIKTAIAPKDTLKDVVGRGIWIVRNYEAHLHSSLSYIGEDLIKTQTVEGAFFRLLARETIFTRGRRRLEEIGGGSIKCHITLRA